jgi:hypothetical protein
LKKAQLLDPWPAARALTSVRMAGATLADFTTHSQKFAGFVLTYVEPKARRAREPCASFL